MLRSSLLLLAPLALFACTDAKSEDTGSEETDTDTSVSESAGCGAEGGKGDAR
jgi:hypothetical protein